MLVKTCIVFPIGKKFEKKKHVGVEVQRMMVYSALLYWDTTNSDITGQNVELRTTQQLASCCMPKRTCGSQLGKITEVGVRKRLWMPKLVCVHRWQGSTLPSASMATRLATHPLAPSVSPTQELSQKDGWGDTLVVNSQ